MTYYAINISKKQDGKIAFITKSGEKAAMEYQYHLMCASSAQNTEGDLLDVCEWGTVEGGKLERAVWNNEVHE